MRILLAEDDRQLNQTLAISLELEGFTVDSCFDGEEALYYGEQNIHDVILLDRMLPHMDGTQVLTKLRKKGISTPVIFLTALGTLNDKVTGLDLGADDYLVKPFETEELLARIRCITRRPSALTDDDDVLSVSDIHWYMNEDRLAGPSGSCTLSKREAALMETFLRRKNQTLSRNLLLLKVWGPDSDVEDGNLDNYIHFLLEATFRSRPYAGSATVSTMPLRLKNKSSLWEFLCIRRFTCGLPFCVRESPLPL